MKNTVNKSGRLGPEFKYTAFSREEGTAETEKVLSPTKDCLFGIKDYLCAPKHVSLTMQGIFTILLLILSNIFMTFAWYGHLKLQEMKISTSWPLILVILFSWAIAFFEYCAQVPANRIGFNGNGGPFSLMQLKVIQEVISLTVFTLVVTLLFKGQPLQWNHFVAFGCLILAVFFVFLK